MSFLYPNPHPPMKPGIHPEFYAHAKITCTACGAIFTIPSTVKEIHIEVCSNCHPIYTGKHRGALTSGRVERFRKRLAAAAKAPPKTAKHKKLSPEEKLEKKLEIKRIEKAATAKKPSKAKKK